MNEPTVVLCRCDDQDLRVPIWPDRGSYEVPGARVAHQADQDPWVVTVQAPGGADAGDRRPRPRLARRGARQQPLEARGRLAVYPADDAARRVVAVPGVRPALDRGRSVRRPVRPGRLQGRRPAGSTAGRRPPGPAPSRRLREAIFGGQFTLLHFPWPELVVGRLLRGRALQLLQRQAALGRPGVPPLPVPPDVELPDRRPGVRRALLRRRATSSGRATTAGR